MRCSNPMLGYISTGLMINFQGTYIIVEFYSHSNGCRLTITLPLLAYKTLLCSHKYMIHHHLVLQYKFCYEWCKYRLVMQNIR